MAANWRFDLELALLNQGKQMSSKSKLVPKTSGAILSSFLIFQAIACSSPTTPPQLAGSSASRNAYNTAFPLQENPISEGGKWIGGQSAGRNLWGDVQTKENFAFGVSEPTKFGDPTAILAGLWGPDQTVSGVVRIATTPTGQCCREVELRLRATISNDGITGYEAYCSVMPVAPYCHIARWNGPNGRYCNIDSSTPVIYAVDGDVLTAKVTGTNPTIITMYKNGAQIARAIDVGQNCSPGGAAGPFTSGSPGIGFYNDQDSTWSIFGFSSFSAKADFQNP
ncbi:MAG TPA: hypothetical protein VKD70_07600 [Candidatus Acidoferrum sp.]|nr:hypothetical protein [Candidatus Acidoferrum sp.]